ncbi:hypothetical protein IAR55_005491 [Kwoniella newhampshirensis]|uniref:Uncharacterized protein n=1 Tax=Kwoniella newhampshirensis TaxID=1651941 RepID=A0AAW0YWA8_9TREE
MTDTSTIMTDSNQSRRHTEDRHHHQGQHQDDPLALSLDQRRRDPRPSTQYVEDQDQHSSPHRPNQPRETDPMLPSQVQLQLQQPALTHLPPHVQDHIEVEPDPSLTSAPEPPAKSSPVPPLSKRLFQALVNKPTLSRTWEKRSYADQQRSAPVGGQMDLEGGPNSEFQSPRPRPISFYASPADIAAFRPLPMVEGYSEFDRGHPAPATPAPPAMV